MLARRRRRVGHHSMTLQNAFFQKLMTTHFKKRKKIPTKRQVSFITICLNEKGSSTDYDDIWPRGGQANAVWGHEPHEQ